MANALAGSLVPVSSLTESLEGTPLDISTRSAARVTVDVSAVAGSVTVVIQTSPDGSTWRSAITMALSAVGKTERVAYDLSSNLRAVVTLASGATVTLSVSAVAHDIYCHPEDITRYGLPLRSIPNESRETLVEMCLAATDVSDGFVGAAYTLPLLAWGHDLKLHTAKIATRLLLDQRGWDPEKDEPIVVGYDNAMSWLSKLGKGHIAPPGIRDSTPTVVDSGSVVRSRSRRESFR